jgi:cation diffusion facilitator CzcD-associated flavoprotein CzcO
LGRGHARAYLGITMPGFPNFFCLLGPNTFAGHGGSGIVTIELGVRYVMEMLKKMLAEGITSPMPWTNYEYWQMAREPDLADFEVRVGERD